MGSGPTSGRRTHRRLIEICFVLVAFFATALVTAGVVAGQGPLAALSSASSGDTDTTATDPTEPAPTEPEPEPSPADTEPPWPEATEPYLVKFASGTSAARQDEVLAAAGAVSQSYVRALRIHSVLLPGGDSLEASLEALDSFDEVARVEPNRTREVSGTPSDSRYGDQWALPKIGWDTVFGSVSPGGSARVAILDTGVDGSHPDLDGVVVPGTSILDGSNGLSDPNGHGTAMAGIVAAETDNGAGIAGVGYAGVQVMPVTVLGSDGTGQDGDIIEGVVYAAEAGADVILMAFSNPGYSELLQEAIDYAWDEGAVLIAAAGNDGSSTVTFPAGDRGVVGVSATDQSDALGGGSNSGQAVFLGAPGVDIATTSPGGGYGTVTGSSAAAAHVAGAAALVKAVSGASNGVIVGRLARTAEPAGSQGETGNGRLQLDRALADESTDSVQPAGADPVGSGGPYVGPYAVAANSFSGVAAPNSVAGGSTNNLVFTITATNSGNPGSSRNVTLTVPTGWTAPQTGAGAGQVNLGAGTCSVSNLTVTGMVISVTQPTGNGCTNGQTIIINYNQATAPTPTSPSQVYTFTLSPSGRSPTVTVTAPVGPTKLAFTTPALTGVYGQCLGPITVQTQNASNVATNVTSDTTVSLATNATGTFFGDSGCTTSVTSAVIPSGSNSGSFYYRPDGVGDGSHQLTASATGLTPASQTQTINKATLTVTASSPPDGTYGDPAPTITPQYAGFVLDDDADDLDTPPTCSTTYTQGAGPGTYPTSCSGGADDNYSFTYVNGSFVVAKKELTVTASSPPDGTYGDPAPTITPQYAGFVLDDDADDLDTPPTCSTTYTQGAGPGTYPTSCSGGADDNYSFTYVNGSFVVAKKELTVTASSPPDGTYGDPAPTITPQYAGFVLDDDADDLDTPPTCSTTYTQGAGPGTYPTSCSGGADDNYSFTYVNGSFVVAKKELTVTASSPPDGTYGDPAPTITPQYAGFVLDDDADDLDTPPTCSTTYTQGAGPGTYPTSCSGGADDNYSFTYVNGSFVVAKKELTVTASSPPDGTYGDPAPTITPQYAGFVLDDDADDLDTPPTCSTTYTQGAGPGTYPTSCSGGADDNYSFTYVNGSFVVAKKELTVTASSPPDGTYGDPAPTITPQYAGFVLDDDADDLDTPPTCSTTYTQGAGPGTYPTSCSGGADDNYSFTYVNGSFVVAKKELTVTASSPPDGTYGDPAPTITPQYAGFVLDDDADDLDTPPTCSTTYTQGAGPGTYPTSCSGGADDNYSFTYVNGSFVVAKKELTVTASSPPDGTYGDPAPTITPQYAGFVLDDDADDLDTPPTCSTTYTQGAGPGTYPTSCSGGADDNYSFTYVNGSFVVAKKELTVTADNQTAQYSDPSPTLTFQYTGFVLGENPMVIDAPPTCSTTRTTESAPGEYPITCSSGADDNYSFAYVAGTFTVTQENASAIYTGDMLAFTAPGGSTASVLLRATVIDAPDGSPGNITNAKVAFKDNGTLLCSSLPVAPINSGDTTTGSAECTASLGVGDHTLTIEINGYYVGSGPGVVTVSQPDGSFITGGGYTVVQSSVGQHAADAGSRMNYGFNIKYNKSMKNLQGHVNIIFRKGGKTYQIKANAMESLGIAYRKADNTSCPGPPSATCFGLAEFRSKANLTDVTDPSAPVSLGGNLTLQMALTDKGEPGRDDEIAVTLWQGSTLLFSSNWNGAATVKQKIAGGNMVVH